MIVGIHQPNFFPWLGFFDKMVHCDVFIILDDVQFIKRGYQNRVQLKYPTGSNWFTLPVITKGRWKQVTCEVEIDTACRWRRSHMQTFDALYGKAAYYADVKGALSSLYEMPTTKLAEFNIPAIRWLTDTLGIKTRIVRSSEFGISSSSSRLLLELVKAVGGTIYLSGPTGRKYLDEKLFLGGGVQLQYHNFTSVTYPQRFGGFIPGLSVLDYLFNVGPIQWWQSQSNDKSR